MSVDGIRRFAIQFDNARVGFPSSDCSSLIVGAGHRSRNSYFALGDTSVGLRPIRAGDILEQNFVSLTPHETPNVQPPAKPTEFANTQLSLFQHVLCNTDDERERFSNAIDLWDSVPRYSVSRQAQTKARENGKFLDNHTAAFQHRDRTYTVTISPARVNDLDGSQRDYYPSTIEELVEEALRKLAIDQYAGFFDKPTFRSGVVFTIYQVREEKESCWLFRRTCQLWSRSRETCLKTIQPQMGCPVPSISDGQHRHGHVSAV